MGATRVIFDGAKESTVVGVDNKDNTTNIVQSWLSVVDTSSPVKDAFIITPPLFRLNSGEKGFVGSCAQETIANRSRVYALVKC